MALAVVEEAERLGSEHIPLCSSRCLPGWLPLPGDKADRRRWEDGGVWIYSCLLSFLTL